ncbi:hypothetical protein Q1695_011089 [Nippostrongylus brasiliensis]|nr:hypothetical protein Q1695_011089 [Nippostrongylus brasiliensis]
MGFLFSKLIRNIVILYVIFSAIQYVLRSKTYTISPKEFRTIAAKATGAENIASAVSRLTTDLRRTYGPAIHPDPHWVALPLGGLPLRALFLHTYFTEFIGVIGTPYAATGRLGMHWSNSTCTVLMGSVSRLPEDGQIPRKESFSMGGNFRHGQFESYIYSFTADTYVACYGRGVMPFSGLWVATGSLATGEPLLFGHTAHTFGQGSVQQLMLVLSNTFKYYKAKATGKTEL